MKKTRDTKSILLRVLLYLFVILVVLVTLYPYFVMFTTAAKSRAEIYSTDGTLLPIHWLWQNFKDIWTLAPLSRYFINSLIVAGGSTLIAIVCGIPAASALARMMSTFGMTDSLVGLVFINAAFNPAFAIWLLRGTFISISPEMEQAATVDGCGKVSALIRILLPVAAPGIVTALIFVFINAWNEYTVALTLISTDVLKPLTVGITIFNGYNMVEWQYLFASSLFATVPVVILFVAIEKHLVGGLTSGGVKG